MNTRLKQFFPVGVGLLAIVSLANAQTVTLSGFSPNPAQAVTALVTATGAGFPSVAGAETILPTAVTITLTPSPGNGSVVTTAPVSLTKVIGTSWKLAFRIPASLASSSAFTVTAAISGSTTLGRPFSGTSAPNALQISPAAVITNASPGAVTRGTSVTVKISAANTHFLAGSTTLDLGQGVACTNVVPSGTMLTASCAVSANATPGLRNATASTGSETASLADAVLVSATQALSFASFTPATVLQGETRDIIVDGGATHFAAGQTVANFSDGIRINSVNVLTQTRAVVNITADPLTPVGFRVVTLATGGEYALAAQTFTVGAGPAYLTGITPNALLQGTTRRVDITGVGTHFAASASTVNLGPGVTVGNVTVTGPLALSADITVSPAAASGPVLLRVITGGEDLTLPGAFTIGAASPFISVVNPTAARQGQTLDVLLTGTYTNFSAGTTATFGQGVTVNSVTAMDASHVRANISIDFTSPAGGHAGNLHTPAGIDLPFNFTVQSSAAAILSAAPVSGLQGSSVSIQVSGSLTHFVQGTTTAAIVYPNHVIPVNRFTVTDDHTAIVDITIPPLEPAFLHTFTISTGGEVLTVPGGFLVLPATPSLTMSPASGGQGTSFPVEFSGDFTNFTPGVTSVNVSGLGVTFSEFTIVNSFSARAICTVAADAPPTDFNTFQPRVVTLTTGSNFVTTLFVVARSGYLTRIVPNHAAQGQTLTVSIQGLRTSFAAGQTTVTMGPDVTVLPGDVTVLSPTNLSVRVTIGANAQPGWRTAFVNTDSEYGIIGFHVDPPGAAVISAVSPATADQGQSLTVGITGENTNFRAGFTQAILGAGVAVSSLIIDSRYHATAQISVLPTAYAGQRTVSMITPLASGETELAQGLVFEISKGIAILTDVTPAHGLQGDVVTVDITGANTHFLSGSTVASVGGGVTVTSLSVHTATTATAQLSIASDAVPGLQTVTLSTAGESAQLLNGFTIDQGTPALLSATPNTARQGDTLNVTLLGRSTHWTAGATNVSFGPAARVNSVQIPDRFTAIVNITVDPTVNVGYYATVVTTGAEVVQLNAAFFVSAGSAVLTSVTPNSARQGETASLHITGQNTNFVQGVTTADLGLNINVGAVTVNSPTSADVAVALSPNAVTGLRSIALNTLGQSASFPGGFTVSPGIPTLNSAAPNSMQQAGSGTITITGQFTHFQQGVTTVTFGQGIAVGAVQVTGTGSLTVPVTVDPISFTGPRTVTVTTAGEIVSGSLFTVTAGPAILSSIAPNTGGQGQTMDVAIAGNATHFAQGLTTVSFGPGIAVNYSVVNSALSLSANITIANNAAIGIRPVQVTTGGEVMVNAGGFNVNAGAPVILSLNPASARQGDTNVTVQIAGQFTSWGPGTTVTFSGGDIAVGPVTINNPGSITAVIAVGPTAGLGVRTVAVNAGGQVLTAPFTVVTSAPIPSISTVLPTSALPGQTLNVQITGLNTHFTTGLTTASFGAGIAVNTAQVLSATLLQANVTLDPAAATGARTVTVSTGGEIVTGGFGVAVGVPAITSLSPPAGAQGETKTVNITGQFTTFQQGLSVASFGSGVTVDSLTVNGPTSATASIAIDLLAATGLRPVSVTTAGEVATIPTAFNVTAGPAAITGVSPANARQGDTLLVAISGVGTHFANGVTTASFGGGIAVNNLTVTDALNATASISIAPLATTGSHTVTLTTSGENASLSNAFIVNPGTPVVLSSSPASAQQQMDVSVAVLGQYTNWVQGVTSASLGAGITIPANGVTVTSPVSLTIAAHVTPLAVKGLRDLTVTTGGEVLTRPQALSVVAGPAVVSALNPAVGKQGDAGLSIAITGVNSNWGVGTTASFGPGISVDSFTVNNPQSATAVISISPAASPALQTVTLTTQGETASIAQGFTVQAATPVLFLISPSSATQGQTVDVAVTGSFTHFVQGATTAAFGAGITVNGITVQSATHAVVNVTVQPTAAPGARSVSLSTDTETAVKLSGFTVQSGSAVISALAPASGRQNQTALTITITGTQTNFQQGVTTASFGPGITISNLTVNSLTSAVALVDIAANASLGARTVTLTTGGEVATLATAFAVNPRLLQITTSTLPNATTAVSYSQTVATLGGVAPFNFTVSSGALPSGLSLNPASGAITGTPTTPASYTFDIAVADSSSQTAVHSYAVIDSDALSITTTSLDPGINGLAYSFTAIAQGGVAPLTFSVQSGSLPTGLTLAATGIISGTPTTNGTVNFTLRATDNIGQVFDRPLSIAIYAPVSFTTTTLAHGRRTVAYNQAIVSAGGVPSLSFAIGTGALPVGLTLNAATGAISGTPTAAGAFTFDLVATDSKSHSKSQSFSLVIDEALHITTGATLPNGIGGNPYSQTVQTSDGVAPVSFALTGGALPTGLNLSPATGLISGSPSAPGTFAFAIQATDALNLTDSRTFSLSIDPPPVISTLTPNQLPAGQSGNIAVAAQNTHFVDGITTAALGAGVTVNSVTVTSSTALTLAVTLDANASPGPRTVQLVTGTETATLASGFTVLAGLPAITSLSPAFGTKGASVSVTVTGQNLLGATFQFRSPVPADPTVAGAIVLTSNDGATAVLAVTLGNTLGQFAIVATSGIGQSAVNDASQFVIHPLNMSVSSRFLEILNTDTTSINTGAGAHSVASPTLNVLNTHSTSSPLPAGQNFSASTPINVLNTASPDAGTLPTGQNFAGAIPVAVCNRPSGCPASGRTVTIDPPQTTSRFNPSILGMGADLGAPIVEAADVVEGQTLRLNIADAASQAIAVVEFEVNGAVVAKVLQAPWESLFTVPAGVGRLSLRAFIHSGRNVLSTARVQMAVTPDLGSAIVAREGATLAAGGLLAEYFDFKRPLNSLPDLDGLLPARTGFVTAINQPNPGGLFGSDPLGAGADKDFAARFSGQVWIEKNGHYKFWLTGRSGASFAIGDNRLGSTGFTSGVPESRLMEADLERGWHRVSVEYFFAVGVESLLLEWQQPDAARAVMGPEYLRTALPGVSPDRVPEKFDSVWLRIQDEDSIREVPVRSPRSR